MPSRSGIIYMNFYLTPAGDHVWHGVYQSREQADWYADQCRSEGHRRICYREVEWSDDKQVHDSMDLQEPSGD